MRKAVIFDLYGTLIDLKVDEEPPLFWNALATDFFAPEHSVSGETLRAAFMRLVQKASETTAEGFLLITVFSEMLQTFGLAPTIEHIRRFARKFREHSITCLRKKSYTDDLLASIRSSGYKLGLVSNTEALLTTYDLQVLSLEDKFGAVVLSSDVGIKKPDKRIFEIILERLDEKSQDCAFVGDNFEDDIIGAVNAGMDAVFLTALPGLTLGCGKKGEGRIACAGFDLEGIIGALRRIGFSISSPVDGEMDYPG